MKVVNPNDWQKWIDNNQDEYGSAIICYAERWANLMETEMAAGARLEDVAKRCSHEADAEGITGFMYGAAVYVLSSCWEHGEQLRRWHNLDTQIADEGERANETGAVLNPAMMSVGVREG